MFIISILAYVISAAAIIAYLNLAVTGNSHPFNVVNACGWPVFIASLAVHAYPAAILNLFFTLVGTIGVLQDWRAQRAERDFNEALAGLASMSHVPYPGGQN